MSELREVSDAINSETWTLSLTSRGELFIRGEVGGDDRNWIEFIRPLSVTPKELVDLRLIALAYFEETGRGA
jgi:hypothetical protein